MATFELKDKDLLVPIAWGPEQLLGSWEKDLFTIFPSQQKISDEETVLSGLPARKTIYTLRVGSRVFREWRILVSSESEIWDLTVSGPEELWGSTDNPRYEEVQQLIVSFEFLEPVLARLKAGMPASATTTAAASRESGPRYYTNGRVGIKILLPPEWVFLREQEASFARGHTVVLGRPGTLANVWLVRDLLEASPDLYIRTLEKRVIQTTDGYRKVSEEKVTRSGLEGTKILSAAKEGDIKVRYWVEMFSVGNEHFRITASAPEEVFDRYLDTFEEMMSSVQFLPGAPSLRQQGWEK